MAFWIDRTYSAPPSRTTSGWVAKTIGRQLVDRAADQARIDLDRGLGVELGDEAPVGLGSGHHHLPVRRDEVLAAEGVHRSAGGHEDQDGALGMEAAVEQDARALESERIPGRAAEDGKIGERAADERGHLLLASARAVDQKQREPIGDRRAARPACGRARARSWATVSPQRPSSISPSSTSSAATASNSGRAKLTAGDRVLVIAARARSRRRSCSRRRSTPSNRRWISRANSAVAYSGEQKNSTSAISGPASTRCSSRAASVGCCADDTPCLMRGTVCAGRSSMMVITPRYSLVAGGHRDIEHRMTALLSFRNSYQSAAWLRQHVAANRLLIDTSRIASREDYRDQGRSGQAASATNRV